MSTIGKRIKEFRKKQRLTLAELSEKSGVQLATISRIENSKMTGTLESHLDLAKALGVELVDLYKDLTISDDKTAKSPQVQESSAQYFTYNDRASYEILTTKILTKKMLPVILKIEPSGATNPEQNTADSERFIFVLEGTVTAHIGKDVYHLKTGSSLYFDASLSHYFVNESNEKVRIMSVITPVAL